jgi:hypothetical protein
VHGGVGEQKTDPLAMPTRQKPPTLDHGDLVRRVGMNGIWVMV